MSSIKNPGPDFITKVNSIVNEEDQGIVFVNPKGNEKLVKDILHPLSQKYPDIVFLNLKSDNGEYK